MKKSGFITRKHKKLIEFDLKAKADGFRFLFGVDEAGCGPLAGPVVAAAVFLKDTAFINRVADSKILSAQLRRLAFDEIFERGWVGIGIMNEAVIDEVNIYHARHLAMSSAVHDLVTHLPREISGCGDFESCVKVLIDGNSYKGSIPYTIDRIVDGDAKSFLIGCASVVAKVYRDRLMEHYHKIYPGYGFDKHKGYSTLRHRMAVKKLGRCPIHRKSFSCV